MIAKRHAGKLDGQVGRRQQIDKLLARRMPGRRGSATRDRRAQGEQFLYPLQAGRGLLDLVHLRPHLLQWFAQNA